ncbi:MAG TPA: TetR/AcrR family transcriptional regulator [Ktedonobacteraceae bacterium]|nr:TetR/AcrR family transcriptional regulator [Ktedonobacteraceae bacterium]
MMHKTYQVNDLRVKRTEKLIFDALMQLTIHKGFSAVTVSDITQTAGINRATFYRHYTDKFDLLNQYAQTVYTLLDTDHTPESQQAHTQDRHNLPDGLVHIFDHIREHATFYRVMWGKHGDPDFAEKIRVYIQKRIRKSLPKNVPLDEQRIDFFVSYSASASFGAVLWWLEHDMPYSSEEMIRILQHLESENIKALLK